MRRAVGITGLGTVCGLGVGAEALWDGLCAPRSAIGPIRGFDASGLRARLASEVPGYSVRDFVPKSYRKATKVMCRDTELAVVAASLAARDAGLRTRASEDEGHEIGADRLGCHIGAGLIAAETGELGRAQATAIDEGGAFSIRAWGTIGEEARGGMENLTPLWMLKYLPNMPACHVTIVHGAEGPSNTITCFETSGLLSLGESARVIERGGADACFSGGTESKLNLVGMLRLEHAGRLAPVGEDEEGAGVVRPYDASASGGVAGEGAGILMVEAMEHASERGARVYAQITGFGGAQSFDGIDALYGEGEEPSDGLFDAIERALGDAGLEPEAIDAIVPGAHGAPALDGAEASALRRTFGDRLGEIPLVTTAPSIGSCVAGQGGLQAAVGALCLHKQMLPGRIHAGSPSDGLRAEACDPRDARLAHVLVCASGLGGQNAALVLSRAGVGRD
ncbi:MAG: beta-ketoacyl-[acyl-carrier-protein] synthase family protein [Phycisphaerales bacterium JB059]